MNWNEELKSLILTGNMNLPTEDSSTKISNALVLLRRGIHENCDFIFECLEVAHKNGVNGMIPTTLVLIFTQCNNEKWNECQPKIRTLIRKLDAKTLCELTLYLRNKTFGIGLGSRIQKLLRHTMEAWSEELVEFYIVTQSRYFYSLLRLIHPRFGPKRGKIIRSWMYNNS